MNPFTESTVARPLSDLPRRAANEAAVPESQEASRRSRPGAGQSDRDAKGRRQVRDPRSLRLSRRRAAIAIRRPTQPRAPVPVPGTAKRSLLAGMSAHYRKLTTTLLAATLALGASAAWAVNVNSAGVQELETITGIGPKTAQTIIEERNRGGSFESFDDLSERVKGIGPKKAKSLQAAGLLVGPGGPAPRTPTPAVQRKAGK